MENRKISRRTFLKVSGLALGGSVLACFGLNSLASRALEMDGGEMETNEYHFGGENPADNSLLVGYATYAGSTMEVAAAIGEELSQRGFRVDVKPISDSLQLDGYQAVILGSAVQYGAWLPSALKFVQSNQKNLENKRLALFCVHIQNLEDDPESTAARLAYLDTIRSLVHPEAEAFFAGRFDRRGAALLLPKWVAWLMPVMEKRDWSEIRAWGQSVFA